MFLHNFYFQKKDPKRRSLASKLLQKAIKTKGTVNFNNVVHKKNITPLKDKPHDHVRLPSDTKPVCYSVIFLIFSIQCYLLYDSYFNISHQNCFRVNPIVS